MNEKTGGVRLVRVPDDRDGQRLDNFLLGQLKGAPRSIIYKIVRSGQVRVNSGRAKPETKIKAGDEVRIPPVRLAEEGEPKVAPKGLLDRLAASVVFEDKAILALNKPSGIAAHGGSGVSFGVIEGLRALRPNESIELVHRLDRDTSGVIVLAKKRSALLELQALMVRVDPDGKPSVSHVKVLERRGGHSFCEIRIETGRTHQIRVHAAHIGHPVAGDPKYGDKEANKRLAEQVGLKRLFLHAASMEFALDGGATPYLVTAPLSEELRAVLDRLS